MSFCNSFRVLTKSMIDVMGSILSSSLDLTDNRVPLGIWDNCQLPMGKEKNEDVTLVTSCLYSVKCINKDRKLTAKTLLIVFVN